MARVYAGEVLGIVKPVAGQTAELMVYMQDAAGAPLTGQAFDAAGMEVYISKPGAADVVWGTIVDAAWATDNWAERGHGKYVIVLSGDVAGEANLLDTPGDLGVYVKNTASRGDNFLFRVVSADAARISAAASANLQAGYDGTGYAGGTVKQAVDLVSILGAAITGTAAWLAASFTKFFNIQTPTGTVNSIPDAVAGQASGLALVGSNMGTVGAAASVTGSVGSVASFGTLVGDIATAVWGSATRTLSAFGFTVAATVAGAVGSVTSPVTVGTNNDKTGYALTVAPPTAQAIATYVWVTNATGAAVAATLAGITSLAAWLRGLYRKDAMDAPAKAEVNAGGGTYNEATDSVEAIRDRGDNAWITGSGSTLTAQNIVDGLAALVAAGGAVPGSFAELWEQTLAAAEAGAAAIGTGSKPVTFKMVDGTGTPVPNCKLTVKGIGGATVYVQTTDSTGETPYAFALDPATAYEITAGGLTALFNFANPYSETTGAGTAAETITLVCTALALPTPSDPDNVVLYNDETDDHGVALGAGDMTVVLEWVEVDGLNDADALASRSLLGEEFTTDATGRWSFEIPASWAEAGLALRIIKTLTTITQNNESTWMATLVAPDEGVTTINFAALAPDLYE